jgi:hypothetical protein
VLSAHACVEGMRAAHMNAEAVGFGFGGFSVWRVSG